MEERVDDDARFERALTIAVMVVAALVGTLLVALGPGGDDRPAVATAAASGSGVSTTVAPASTTPSTTTARAASGTAGTTTPAPSTTAPTTTTGDDPGVLPQTDTKPDASGATFTAGVDGLWEAIRQDKPELGLPFFFPKRAYLQVKSISDPAGDYQDRLIANFEADVHSLHAQLGPNAADAQLVGISVPGDQAVWVQPGEEYNQLSYWRVYGTTLQYQVDGQTGSFPVTSLISWRGEWYVVHLGPVR